MVSKNQHAIEFASPLAMGSHTKIAIAAMGLIAAVYFGFIRPAQQHMVALERQYSALTHIVQRLQGKEAAACKGLALIEVLDRQAHKLASAEASLDTLVDLRKRLVEQAQAVVATTATLEQLETVREQVMGHNKTLIHLTHTLEEMAGVAVAIGDASETARQANGLLENLAQQQTGLAREITSVSQHMSSLENEIISRSTNLPEAKQALGQVDDLCEQLAEESADIALARRHMAGLAQLKNEVLVHSTGLSDATEVLTSIWDLRDGLLRGGEAIAAAQQMVVDVMLMEPAVERAVAALKPIGDFQRLSRRAERLGPTPLGSFQAALINSRWTEVVQVAVAVLQSVH